MTETDPDNALVELAGTWTDSGGETRPAPPPESLLAVAPLEPEPAPGVVQDVLDPQP